MPTYADTFKRIFARFSSELLLGICFVLTGLFIGYEGISRLFELWGELAPYLPFQLPDDLPDKIAVSFPIIVKLFVNVVSSICAVLIGILWVIVGFVDALRGLRTRPEPLGFKDPDLVAESLEGAQVKQWHSKPLLARLVGLWPPARSMSPVSYDLLVATLSDLWKLIFLAVVIALATYGLTLLPSLLEKIFHRTFTLTVPDPGPLYTLLFIVAAADLIVALSLVPLRQRRVECNSTQIGVRGRLTPNVFFALLEEGCRLLTPKGQKERNPVRFEHTSSNAKATLIESHPQSALSVGKPIAYVLLPLVVVLLIYGFSQLIYFQPRTEPMMYTEFFAHHFLDYLFEVVLAFGVMLAGLHFAESARRIFDIRTFRSSVVFCSGIENGNAKGGNALVSRSWWRGGSKQAAGQWQVIRGVDEDFARWVRSPQSERRARMTVYWAEVESESQTAQDRRQVKRIARSESLDRAMEQILELPFQVELEMETLPSTSAEKPRPPSKPPEPKLAAKERRKQTSSFRRD